MPPALLQLIPHKELVSNYIRQEYYRTKFIIFLTNLQYLRDIGTLIDLADILHISNVELSKDLSLVAVELDTLQNLKEVSKTLIEYNNSLDLETVNIKAKVEFLSFAHGIEIGSNLYLDENIREEFLAQGKSPVYFDIQRTATKIPVLGVGGGSMSNLLCCRYVLTARKHLKRALFIKYSGDICNSKNQALVPILENDLIVDINGTKPLDLNNEDLNVKLYRVVAIHETKIECEDLTDQKLDRSYIPKKVIEGAHIYHNRDGSYFCSEIKTKKEGVPSIVKTI
jgi:hypothetical protein